MKQCLLSISAIVAALGPVTSAGTIYVDAHATGPVQDETGWCAAYAYSQDALAVAAPSDTIRVAEGTYRPDRGGGQTPGDRSASFLLANGVTWEGGFAGCGALDPNERNPLVYETILSGDLGGDDESVSGSTAENSYHVLTAFLVDAALVDGFTIVGGNADGDDPDNRGGGLLNNGAWPVIRNCTFRENVARFGGAVNSDGGNLTVRDTVFASNAGGFSGAAIRGWQTGHSIDNCLFIENVAEAGGGIWFGASSAVIRNCTFADNRAPLGHAISFDSCCP